MSLLQRKKLVKIIVISAVILAGIWLIMAIRYDNLVHKIFPNQATRVMRAEERQLRLPAGADRYEHYGCYKDVYGQIHCSNSISNSYADLSQLETIRRSFASNGWTTGETTVTEGGLSEPLTNYAYAKSADGQALCGRIDAGGGLVTAKHDDQLRVYILGPGDDDCR